MDFPKNYDEVVPPYLHNVFMPYVMSSEAEERINLSRNFSAHLLGLGVPKTLADDFRSRWLPNLKQKLFLIQQEWISLGIPCPFEASERGDTYVTWRHEKYQAITGRSPLTKEFTEIYEWLSSQPERELLFSCVCYLKLMGANPIFITDKSGDGGIDVIGRVSSGVLQSSCYFVQSKSAKSFVSRETVLTDYAKFLACQSTDLFSSYRDAMNMRKSVDGTSINFVFITNSEFQDGAKTVASDLGILLRSKRQLAYWLSEKLSLKQLMDARAILPSNLIASLERNLAQEINSFF
jgi:hypothetical protein